MRVLVTGATGFLGAYVIDYFEKQGCEILAVGRNQKRGKELKSKQTIFFCGDLTDPKTAEAICKNIDIVIHASALSTIYGKYEDFYQANVQATELLCSSALQEKVKRFVFVSSPSIYAEKRDRLEIKEEDAIQEKNLNYYIKTKKLAENVVKNYGERGLDYVILRPRGLFGVGDTSIIPRLLDVNQGVGIPLFFGGRTVVDMTCVENVAYALYLSATKEEAINQIFNITNGEPRVFCEMLDELFEIIGETAHYRKLPFQVMYHLAFLLEGMHYLFRLKKEPRLTRYTVSTLAFSQTLDLQKARDLLGYEPIISLKEGIENYGQWKKSH
ncbi:MAG: NAD-dependent epimerase/dehydratase family protein [Eubacteriales bacterium]